MKGKRRHSRILVALISTLALPLGSQIRWEESAGHRYGWLEAETLAAPGETWGRFSQRNRWTARKMALPNESGYRSLVPPIEEGTEGKTLSLTQLPVNAIVWVRCSTYRESGLSSFNLVLGETSHLVGPPCTDPMPNDSFTWVRVGEMRGPNGLLSVNHFGYTNSKPVVDLFLFTDDPNYTPPRPLPPWGYFSVQPYQGPVLFADFATQTLLDIPISLCQKTTQQFLFRIRNMGPAMSNFAIEIQCPPGVEVLDPSRGKRWAGDNGQFQRPPFIHPSPDGFIPPGSGVPHAQLVFKRAVETYNPYQKVGALFFLSLRDVSGAPDTGTPLQIRCRAFALDRSWETGFTGQDFVLLSPLPELPIRSGFAWSVDAIYAEMLSLDEFLPLIKTFEQAGLTHWATRVRENVPALAPVNKEKWLALRQHTKMTAVNWGEFWWPGSPYTDESKNYLEAHPQQAGVAVWDDRGRSLSNKLICPTSLLQGDDRYLSGHAARLARLLKDNGIFESMEDAEYSSPFSYCFCPRCRKAFADERHVPLEKVAQLTGEEIGRKFAKEWMQFRVEQNAAVLTKILREQKRNFHEGNFHVFCGYPSFAVKKRYGVDWNLLVKIPDLTGVYVGGGIPGSADQILEMRELCRRENKSFVSMANATTSFPSGRDELSSRTPAYLKARLLHDMLCGSRGEFIWWWGSLEGSCMQAFSTAERVAAKHLETLEKGSRKTQKIGVVGELTLVIVEGAREQLVGLFNVNSTLIEDRVKDPQVLKDVLLGPKPITDVLSGRVLPVEVALAGIVGDLAPGFCRVLKVEK